VYVCVYVCYATIGEDSAAKRITYGALGDSFYEYLMKVWLLTNETAPRYSRMYYDEVVPGTVNTLVKEDVNGLVYLAEFLDKRGPKAKMDHLVCFAGGMFALGAAAQLDSPNVDTRLADDTFRLGAEITRTCHEGHRTATGLPPEIWHFDTQGIKPAKGARHYLLRPETVESYFILYRLTGDRKYQEWGWELFLAIEKHCRVEGGYSGVRDVTESPQVHHDDFQQSFFLAETLKYLYLLYAPADLLPLKDWVFNTEAHPQRRFTPDQALLQAIQ
jgi:mannosyl-oligosaccharide alpha-1,2-mannosidase